MARNKSAEQITLAEHLRAISTQGGNARAASMTPAERSELATKGGKAGGKARAKKLTAAERKKIAEAAAKARWGTTKKD